MQQYLRKAQLVLAPADGAPGIDLSPLSFKFDIRQADLQTPNSGTFRVYNVSAETAARATEEFTRVVLQVGYEGGELGVIFDGDIQYRFRGRENATDTYLDIIAADGDLSYNYALVNTTLAAGAKPFDQVLASVNAMKIGGVSQGHVVDLPEDKLPRGKVMFGMARDTMRDVCNSTQTSWSVQNRKCQVIDNLGYLPEEAVVLNSGTGLVGLPEQSISGINVRCLINPRIKVGSRLKLDNTSIQNFHFGLSLGAEISNQFVPRLDADGLYRVLVIEHHGGTRSNDWYSDIICVGIDDTAPPSLLRSHGVS